MTARPEPLVRMRGLSYRYPDAARAALREVDLELRPGELVVVAGASGSGKSTLLHACCGLVPHYHGGEVRGELVVAGLDIADHGPADLGGVAGLVAQDPEAQVVSTTARGELELPLEIRGEPESARARAVEEVALALGIAGLLDRPTDTLSGGELQRVALAAALVGRPRLVCLDEPTSQLDPVAGDELIWLLRRLNREWGTAILLCEHRLERCLSAADRVLALAGGRVVADRRPEEFLEWALAEAPELATPGARLFDLAGLRPLPVDVKSAREALAGDEDDEWPSLAGGDGRSPVIKRPRPGSKERGRTWRWRPRHALRAALSLRDVWVELDSGEGPREALRGVTLEVERGERVALMGANGAGKSTLLRAAADRLAPARGAVRAPHGFALVPQSPIDLITRDRVADELPGDAGRAALDLVDLGWATERDPRDLSGGERQRLALAIVVAGRSEPGEMPGLVCLDEPTRGMDAARKAELRRWLDRLATRGCAIVLATHDVELAASFAERVVLLAGGELIADGAAEEVLAGGWYFTTEVARILGAGGTVTPERGAELLRGRALARGAR